MLLWLEFKELHPDACSYSAFCQQYRDWRVAPRRDHAPGAQGRREAVRRLPGDHDPDLRRADLGGELSRRALRRRHGCVELPLRRGTALPGARALDHAPTSTPSSSSGCARDRGAGQPASRRHQGPPLRAGPQRHLPGDGAALRRRHHPRAPLQAPRQGQGRSRACSSASAGSSLRCAHRRFTSLSGAQRGDRAARRRAQRAALQEARGLARLGLRRGRPPGASARSPRRATSSPPGPAPR